MITFKAKFVKHRKPSVLYVDTTLEDLDGEIWYPIKDFEGYYLISNYARVKHLARPKTSKMDTYSNKTFIVKPKLARGYLQLTLCKNSVKSIHYLHKLVAIAFISNPNNYKYVNHKDENKLNNIPSNLEWCTALYNNLYNDRASKAGAKKRIKVYVYKHNGLTKDYDLHTILPKISNCNKLGICYCTIMKYIDSDKSYTALDRNMYKFYSYDYKQRL